MQTSIERTFKTIAISICFSAHCSLGEVSRTTCVPDSGRTVMSKRTDLIEILESMDQRSIAENFTLIAKIDSTILLGIPSINPVSPTSKPYYTSQFGKRIHPVTSQLIQHNGIDIATEFSFQYVHATAEGVVNNVSFSNSAGIYVKIDHIAGYETTYMHLAGVDVSVGEKVKIGQMIGWMGASGRVTGKHVHYEIKRKGRAINPLPYLDLYFRCLQANLSGKER
jgi:murein DD-endopeptidase MepM/ murein hydrolase activator NlpD